jgi:hypothetical protein
MDKAIQKLKSAAKAVGNLFSSAGSAVKSSAIKVHDYLGTNGTIAAAIAVVGTVAVTFINPTSAALAVASIVFAVNLHRVDNPSLGQCLLLVLQSCAMGVLVTFAPIVTVGLVAYVYVSYRSMDLNPAQAWGDFWALQVMKNDEYPISEGCWCFLLGWWNTTIDVIFHPLHMRALEADGWSLGRGYLSRGPRFSFVY